jgi:hypothetical protein
VRLGPACDPAGEGRATHPRVPRLHAHQVCGISSAWMRWFAQRPRLQLAFEFCYFVLQSISSSMV